MKLTLALDSTQIVSYLNCPQQWSFLFNESIRKADLKTKALDQGSIMHNLFDIYYTLRALNPEENYQKHATATVEMFKKSFAPSLILG